MLRALADLALLVLPVSCAGCGEPDTGLCGRCRARFAGPERCEHRAGRLDRVDGTSPVPVWCTADLVGPVRHVVTTWKDEGRRHLGRDLGGALRRAAQDQQVVDRCGGGPVLVVPVPTSGAARRRRGGDLVRTLAEQAARGLVMSGVQAEPAWVLSRASHRDSSGLGARGRGGHAGIVVRPRWSGRLVGRSVVVVDDVLTTGATLAACVAAVVDAGATVVAGLVVASTPAPGERPAGRGRILP
jgi:predicted amidophosphoribosyltransferase